MKTKPYNNKKALEKKETKRRNTIRKSKNGYFDRAQDQRVLNKFFESLVIYRDSVKFINSKLKLN